MKRKTSLKIAAALIASTLIALPIASAYAGSDGHHGGRMLEQGQFKEFGFDGAHRDHDKRGIFGKQHRERATPLSVDEARILVDAMLLRSGGDDLKIGDALLAEEPGKIDVLLVNGAGDLVDVVTFDAKKGRLDHGERRSLRKLMPRPDKEARFDRSFTDAQMNTLAQAMVIRFGQGELKLGKIAETDRGTYVATVTNKAGDIVREMELSRVTGRPIS